MQDRSLQNNQAAITSSVRSFWPLFVAVSNARFIAALMLPFVNQLSHLQSCGRCLHPCTLVRARPTALHYSIYRLARKYCRRQQSDHHFDIHTQVMPLKF
jgi:hypothetical protein